MENKPTKTPKPDTWVITEPKIKSDGTTKPPELIWEKNNQPLVRIPLTHENFDQLLTTLHTHLNTHDNTLQPDLYHINPKPDTGEPVLSFTHKNKILMSLPMSQAFLKTFIKQLQHYHHTPPNIFHRFATWWKTHTKLRILLIILTTPIIATFLYSIIQTTILST